MTVYSEDGTTFSFAGGTGSISWTSAEITETGAVLNRIAQLLDPLVDRLRSEWSWLADAGAAPYPFECLDLMRGAWWQCTSLQCGIASLAKKTTQVGINYAQAETLNARAMTETERVAKTRAGLDVWAWGALAPAKFGADLFKVLTRAKHEGLRDTVEQVLRESGAYLAGAQGPGIAMMFLISAMGRKGNGPAGERQAFLLRKLFDATTLTLPGHLAVREVPAQEWDPKSTEFYPAGHANATGGEPCTVEVSIEGMLAGSSEAYDYPPGSIGVVRLKRPDGTNAWVVHLPGTEDWSTMDSSNPFDMEGNIEGLTAASQKEFEQQEVLVQQLIKTGLASSGAVAGEDVVLTGHSGGGIHAAAAAADPAFLADVNVRMIVIAGAPAKNSGVGDEVSVLDLQNENDIVTALDYGPPPPSKNWVSVTSHRPAAAEDGTLAGIVADAHSIKNYTNDATLLDQSNNPAVAGSRETLRNLLGVGVAGAAIGGTKWVYQGRDVNNGTKAKPEPKSTSAPVWSNKTGSEDRYRLGIR